MDISRMNRRQIEEAIVRGKLDGPDQVFPVHTPVAQRATTMEMGGHSMRIFRGPRFTVLASVVTT